MSILHKLRNTLPDLPKKLALAARYALDHPDQVALNSMRSIATEVGVTSTTMLRLARQLGYDGYDDFRASFQNELVRGVFGTRADALHQDQNATDSDLAATPETLTDRILLAAETNIRHTRATLRHEEFDTAANLIGNAPNVYLVGSGSLFWLASMMKNTGNLMLSNLRLVGAEYSVAAEAMGSLSENDVVVGFGMNPTATRTIDAMTFSRKRDAHLIAITDRPSSPVAERADCVLFSDNFSPHYYPSAVPLMVIVEALLATIVANGDGTELQRIKTFEATRRNSGRYIEY